MTVPTATSFVNPLPGYAHGEGWQGRPLVSTSIGDDVLNSLGAHGGEVADPMIEAGPPGVVGFCPRFTAGMMKGNAPVIRSWMTRTL
jgi:hypothetical protein